ncbi:hypothetical protein BBP00_00007347 [Phytophthora kernoviae]|uniref:Uncharacterized protein n=1 Tax=Phytophthora kernoviae TaxID=325452 RepID=A0A3F2RID9_9STRA|nr:hypothetical protein BBP00_00007347 [Phytophthora kernoviae]
MCRNSCGRCVRGSNTQNSMVSSSKVADIIHKTVTGGLVLATVFALADVTRGFSVLVKRNTDRTAEYEAQQLKLQQQQQDATHQD